MQNEGFLIIKATSNHVESVYRLINELEDTCFRQQEFYDLFIKNLQNEDYHYYVAEYQDKIVAFMGINIQYPLHHCGKIAEIQELIVNYQYRNLKIGNALINTAKTIAQENNCDTLELSSRFKRIDAHRFYEREGFQKTHFKFLLRFEK